MTLSKAEPLAVQLLRDIIEGDDAAMARAIEEGRTLLKQLEVSAKRGGPPDAIDRIMAMAAEHYGFTVSHLLERNRTARLVNARQVAMWLCRSITSAPFEEIGRRFGRDHGTVIHAVEAVDNYASTDTRFKTKLTDLRIKALAVCGRASE